jgi:hypothetical protein
MDLELILLSAAVTIFSLDLLVVSLLSYGRYRNNKLLFTSVVFFLFFIKGLYLSVNVYYETITDRTFIFVLGVADLLILILLYVTSLKR